MSTELLNVADIFGENVFNDTVMQERLPKKIYKNLKKTIEEGKELDLETADVIAHEMKEWAIEKGATHYTHWFLPLTGVTAEKHDSFISAPLPSGKVLMSFSGKELIKGEPDASSFPSGGLRATFEARGYTAWDCTSPAFVRQDAAGATLCIPTAFCSYTGEALDQKTPLLRSMEAINTQALRLLRLFGNTTSKKVTPSVGVEQEYFLVDAEKFMQRKDLIYTGRTLFGAMPPKGQELDDHYFGTIRQRIASFMRDVNIELWKVGVSAKTQHNEVAPAQHELAPIYAEANIAVDHNQIIMQTLKRVACQHGMKCLLHEKPFAGVNGSGKHDNWSITTDDGINMLEPGKTPHENTQFLLVLACILKAVYKHADLLRQSAADPGNDHRLGANEAPPAIISVFLGEQLEDVRQQLISTGTATHSLKGGKLETGVTTLPDLSKDATDRNRTSPFAFTGNKFEFRMVGSRDSVANSNIVLNTIVAEAFADACDVLEKADDFELAVHDLIKEYMIESDKVVFNGNGYSDEWVAEAERRGLPNIKSMVESIPAITTDKAVALFERFSVFTKAELESRAEIEYEAYAKAINIEARTMIDMASKQFIPAVMKYTKQLADTVIAVKEAGVDAEVQAEALREVSVLLKEAKETLATLKKATEEAAEKEEGEVQATYYHSEVVPAMEALRVPVDKLEMIVDKEAWPMPSYGDLIFEV
ncbi:MULTISPECIES: glutamine synthetase III family protein [Clostridia]|uniref:glutamine synthetase III family protein n=1 Tax=Clostridia TaxID=186801 RepID=UPI000E5268CA|nr:MULTISPECIES: glutamine synthetase III [Clostridia]RGH38769.1 glutamine synthetase type III [Firmicutes bacterium AM41-5BH]RHS78875.1 glutamine synthetase type III [Firmicutes bacterium AM43-11BH]RHV05148.1 glutamine synthetase type III [Firmicutes bacterium OM07-11]RKQ30091.1 glutamine synthetase type III [Ruminococcus sp. B05]TAP35425.1 glutamine synthetase type III [Mediterraneibacter sp. gm002]